MSTRRDVGRYLVTALLTGSLISSVGIGSGTASAGPAPGGPADRPAALSPTAGAATYQVTLVTGDRVTVSAGGAVSVTAAASRRGVQFTTYRQRDGHQFVVPADAAALISAGKLDSRLFDVTALVGYGYDDRRADLPLIVKHARDAKSAARVRIAGGGARVTRELASVSGDAVRADRASAAALWSQLTTGSGVHRKLRPEISGVWLDSLYKPSLDHSVPQIGAPTAWAAGYNGTGVKVAVLDSGIDTAHPDLAGKVIATQNFTTEPNANDLFGHGTHVASIVAGSGAASGGLYRGVAPGASLLNGKVCVAADNGSCPVSAILAGMEWAAQQGADVVNMSLGGPDTEGVDPLEEAVNTLTASYGTLFVIAAGNTPGLAGDFSVSSPSTADAALSVGAVDDSDNLASFSNRGPRVGDTALKPDITAPGVSIKAARSSTGVLGEPGEAYLELSGTSMATPHTAGAAAILAQRRPTWTPAQLKAALMGSAEPSPAEPTFHQGAGRLDIGRGYAQTVLANPPSISLGRQLWPHGDDPVLTRTVTYANTGTSAVTLNLVLSTRDPNGSAAPAGMFTLSPSTLTLAPGASAPVTLTATTSVAGPDGFYGGYLTATATGGLRVGTPFAVDRSTEGYEVTLDNIDRNGVHTTNYVAQLFPLTPGNPIYTWVGTSGPVTKFVQKGTYLVQSNIFDSDAQGQRSSAVVTPKLEVTANRPITFDARTAGQVNVGVSDDALEQPFSIEVASQLIDGNNIFGLAGLYQNTRVYIGQADPNQREVGYTGKVVATLTRPGTGGGIRNTPRSYHLGSFFGQNLPSGWAQSFTTGALARVDASIGAHVPGATEFKGAHAYPGSGFYGAAFQQTLPFDPPFTHTEYYNTGSNLRWQSVFSELIESTNQFIVTLEGGLSAYTAGTTVAESWNRPVYGPAHGAAIDPARWVVRQGNFIGADVQLFGDGYGHPGRPWLFTSGQVVLKRNGTVVGSQEYPSAFTPVFEVPGGFATYRLEVNAERGAPAVLSTQVSAAWTFGSDTTGGTTPVRLPIWNVSFRPTLNASNTAAAGTAFSMPATVAVQPNSTASGLSSVTVQYSTNDGATWTNATVTGSGLARTVTVTHPNITGFVSLKATATDFAGNSVEQTVIRAYKIAP